MTLKGRGAQIQTHNKFLNHKRVLEHLEGLDEAADDSFDTQFFIESAKNVVNKITSPDVGGTVESHSRPIVAPNNRQVSGVMGNRMKAAMATPRAA